MEITTAAELARRLRAEVLEPVKASFIEKDGIVDLLGVGLVSGENVFLLGPPGTAKSAVVRQLAARLDGRSFDYLLTRFTEPAELFGPFDIRRLREGELVTNTEGMLPEASLVFLDELLNANSALLNTLLTALNERVFRRGRETRPLEALMFAGASNTLPEDEALRALFDRFLLRARSDNAAPERLEEVLHAGWKLSDGSAPPERSALTVTDLRELQAAAKRVNLSAVRPALAELVRQARRAGIALSDRRAVKVQNAVAASALLCGRTAAAVSDLWVFRHLWDTEDQMEVLAALTAQTLEKEDAASSGEAGGVHPRARDGEGPDPEVLARDIDAALAVLRDPEADAASRAAARDRLALLAGRCEWVRDPAAREALKEKMSAAAEAGG